MFKVDVPPSANWIFEPTDHSAIEILILLLVVFFYIFNNAYQNSIMAGPCLTISVLSLGKGGLDLGW